MLKTVRFLPAYFVVSTSTAITKFFFVSLLIRNLGAEQFARWSLYEPAVVILSQLLLLGVSFGIIKQITQDKRSPAATTRSLFLAVQPLLVTLCVALAIASSRLGLAWPAPISLALLTYAEAIFLLLFSAYRAASSVGAFAVSSLAKVLSFLGVLLLALKVGRPVVRTAEDVIFWSFVTSVAGLGLGFLAALLLHRRSFFTPDLHRASPWRTYGDAVRYGFPLLATSLLAMGIEYVSRYVLDAHVDRITLAHYVVYGKIAAALDVVITTPFGLWWPTERFIRMESPDGGRRFFRITSVGMLVVLLVAAGDLWLASGWMIGWFAPGVPPNRLVLLLLLLAVVARGMGYPLNVGALKEGKTHWNILGALGAAVINTALCFVLIPVSGITGAACAALLSQTCYTGFLTVISQRLHPVPLPYLRMLAIVVLALVLMLVIARYFAGVSGIVQAATFSLLSVALVAAVATPRLARRHAS